MQGVGTGWFWCLRCGTVRSGDTTCIPSLVMRCRQFDTFIVRELNVAYIADKWLTIGIDEAINLPSERRGR
jgi:hypothetical protein